MASPPTHDPILFGYAHQEFAPENGFCVGTELMGPPDVNYSDELGYSSKHWELLCMPVVNIECRNVDMQHCYAISVLRALFSFPGVNGWAQQHASFHRDSDDLCILCMLSDDLEDMSKEGLAFVPRLTIHRMKWSPYWTDSQPECAMEAFVLLLEHCQAVDENSINAFQICGNEAAIFTYPSMTLFGGLVQTTSGCTSQSCRHVGKQAEVIVGLSVNIPSGHWRTLEVALEQSQQCDLKSQSHCAVCGEAISKKLTVLRWPPILVVHLKRWHFSSGSGWMKDKTHVQFGKLMLQGGKLYALKAVVCHEGSASTGHCVTYITHTRPQYQSWLKCDDLTVTRCTWETVMKVQGYVFFYEVLTT